MLLSISQHVTFYFTCFLSFMVKLLRCSEVVTGCRLLSQVNINTQHFVLRNNSYFIPQLEEVGSVHQNKEVNPSLLKH